MKCLELSIPPLPQFVTGQFTKWPAGHRHFERTIDVYDVLVVVAGKMYMTEDGVPYEVKTGDLLVLTPNLPHYGHRDCETATDIFWLHFIHPEPARILARDDIPWLAPLPQGISKDTAPPKHVMYIPKYASIELALFRPLLERIVRLQSSVRVDNALELHALLAEFLSQLQRTVCHQFATPSQKVSALATEYIRHHLSDPFKADHMEEELHYRYDYISRCFKKHAGMTPVEYLQHVRMEEAQRLLVGTDLAVREVGEKVGLPDANYFIKVFRRTTGFTPGKYRDEKKSMV